MRISKQHDSWMQGGGNGRMKVIIDCFEGDFAVVETEDKTMVNIPKVLVPDAKEGDVISIEIDTEATDERKKKIGKMMDQLWKE